MFAKNKNMIAGIFLLIVSIVYGLLSFSIPLTNIDKLVGSRLLPQVCAIILGGCSVWLILDNLIKNKKGIEVVQVDEDGVVETQDKPRTLYMNTVFVLLGLVIYIFLMDKIGFLISTILYLISQMIILEKGDKKKRYVLYSIISICTSGSVYLLFTQVFNLMLPKGLLF